MSEDDKWRDKLSAEEYRICREKGTEPAFSGEYWDKKDAGSYLCKCCGEPLFTSEAKYDSGCGWPSFFQPLEDQRIQYEADHSLGMQRVEIMCKNCGCHLGHVFEDGPEITGKRYCVNSASVSFKDND